MLSDAELHKRGDKVATRITSRVPDDINKKLDYWCKRLGMTKTQFSGVCIQAGIESVIRGIAPLESLSDEQLARVLRVGADYGLVLKDTGDHEEK